MALAGVLFFFPVFFPTFKQHEWHGLDLGLCALGVFVCWFFGGFCCFMAWD